MVTEQIAILDFGSQYTHLLARRIRGFGVLAKIHPAHVKPSELRSMNGIILSGGPQSVGDAGSVRCDPTLFQLGIPVLGICYGHQLLAFELGGEVRKTTSREYGRTPITAKNSSALFSGIPERLSVWMSHGDSVVKLPPGFERVAGSMDCPVVAMEDSTRRFYGIQFHPEVSHTDHGTEILKKFVLDVCHAEQHWDSHRIITDLVEKIRDQAGNRNIFLLVSGGVDSVVALALLDKALGRKRVLGIHIDNGFMRTSESQDVMRTLAELGFDNIDVVNASEEFLEAISGVFDPEKKRQCIGKTFLKVKDQALRERGLTSDQWCFAQGTIYPDTIESGGTKHAERIKTHHNRVDEIFKLMKEKKIIEPIADLYKDEVRMVGTALRLPDSLLKRHPFPGPGLAIRVLCAETAASIRYSSRVSVQEHIDEILKKYNTIFGLHLRGTMIPVQSVGVQGDQRTYKHPIVLDGDLAWETLLSVSQDLTNRISEINRVLVLVSGSFPDLKRAVLHEADVTRERLHVLRLVDDQVNHTIRTHYVYDAIWQFPVVLLPFGSTDATESIVLRPVESIDGMTANAYELPDAVMLDIAKSIDSNPQIEFCFYDITSKPPGTIEWE
ncbi:MAG: glutamine-hydrolyzing GMP synthase [Candidatus Kerfeldbacteria bacterium]|nr:glutamine-hydrolyzing GMP synthase [Candidatus Kerfeldbacteria bacterium]